MTFLHHADDIRHYVLACQRARCFAGRSLSLLDPTYASKYIPIIASVSEHQPPAWPSYFTDLHLSVLLMPAGLVSCFRPLTPVSLFLILYGATAVYFSGVMVSPWTLTLCHCRPRALAAAGLLPEGRKCQWRRRSGCWSVYHVVLSCIRAELLGAVAYTAEETCSMLWQAIHDRVATGTIGSGLMQVRLMLVLAPAACCLAGIAAHEVLLTLSRSVRTGLANRAADKADGADKVADKAASKPASFKASGKNSKKGAADGGKVCCMTSAMHRQRRKGCLRAHACCMLTMT